MPDKKEIRSRIKCELSVSGTDEANASAVDDLLVDDPEEEGKADAAIKEATDGKRNIS